MTDTTDNDDEHARFNRDARLLTAEILRVIHAINPPPDILTSGVCVIAASVIYGNGISKAQYLDYCSEAWDAVVSTIREVVATKAGQP